MGLQDVGWGARTDLAQNRWQAIVNAVMNLWVP